MGSRLFALMLAAVLLVTGCSASPSAARERRLSELRRQVDGLQRIVSAAHLPVPDQPEHDLSLETSGVTDPLERATLHRLSCLQYAAVEQTRVPSEPRGDVSGGIFLAHVVALSSDSASATITIDVVTDDMVPWATEEDRRRSSWPDFYGWNKYRHPRSFRLSPDAVFAIREGFHRIISRDEFASQLRSDPDLKDINFYVHVRKGGGGLSEVSELWWWFY